MSDLGLLLGTEAAIMMQRNLDLTAVFVCVQCSAVSAKLTQVGNVEGP